jgi:hypothetical protein
MPRDSKRPRPIVALVRGSRLGAGPLSARGVPAILLGAAAIVISAGVAKALERGAGMLPETLRATRELLLAIRGERRELRP